MTPAWKLSEAHCERLCQQSFLAGFSLAEETGSTNDDCLALLQEGTLTKLPWLLATNAQRAGRGRANKPWWSAPGALAWSIVLPWDRAESTSLLSLAIGLAIARGVESCAPALKSSLALKWPNDVHFQERKLAGVLIEAPAGAAAIVVGIGINVNNSLANAPHGLAEEAIALADIIGTTVPLEDVLTGVLREIELLLEPLRTNPTAITDRWQSRCMLKGLRVGIRQGQLQKQGICEGIDSQGRLVLTGPAGIQLVSSGTVEWIRAPSHDSV